MPRPSPVVWLKWEGRGREGAAYHPAHAIIYTQLHRSYTGVIKLHLQYCSFLSSTDLLRLLASISTLERVDLCAVSVIHVSEAIVRPPRKSLLRRVAVSACTPVHLPFVTCSWTWPRMTLDHPFRLPAGQRQLMNSASRLMPSNDIVYFFDPMDEDGRSCK